MYGDLSEELGALRAKIREMTLEILRLAAERRRLAKEIGKVKERLGLGVLDRRAEAEVIREALKVCRELELGEDFCRRILTLLIEDAVKAQATAPAKPEGPTHREIFARAVEIQRSGRRVYRLEIGEPDFGAPKTAVEEACRALRAGEAKYLPPFGLMELREAIAERLNMFYGADLKPENVLIVPGGIAAVHLAVEVFTNLGDEALVLEPAWPIYKRVITHYGRRCVALRTRIEDGWMPREGEVSENATDATKLLLINYPNNPTGRALSLSELRRLVEEARELGVTVLSDEVYSDYYFMDRKAPSVLQILDEGYAVVGSFSKSWAMTGYRIGYLVAGEEEVKKAAAILDSTYTCVPQFVQRAAIAAIRDEEAVKENVRTIRERIESMKNILSKSRLVELRPPEGAMYIFPRVKIPGFRSGSFALKLLEEKGVAVGPGSGFGPYPEYIRLSAGRPVEELRKGVELMLEALEEFEEKGG